VQLQRADRVQALVMQPARAAQRAGSLAPESASVAVFRRVPIVWPTSRGA
jgi:hypothetical protein